MRRSLFAFLTLFPLVSFGGPTSSTVTLDSGEQKVVQVGPVARIVVTHPEIASVSEEKDGLHVHGRAAGLTTVLIWDKAHNRTALTVNVHGKGGEESEQAASEDNAPVIALVPGNSKELATQQSVKRVAVGDPEIADVKVLDANRLEVFGNSEGKTTILVWLSDGSRVSYLASVSAGDQRSVPQLSVKVGEHRDMKDVITGPVSRIAVGNPEIVDMVPLEHWALELVGKAEGKTKFLVWTNDGTRLEYEVTVTR